MKLIIFVLLFSSFAFQNSYGDFDLFNDLKQFVTKVKAGVSVTASEISHKFKPVTKAINKAKHSLLGGLNKGFFDVKKGVINGLDEVIGTPVDIKEVTFYLATQQNFDNLTVVDFLKPSVVVASKIYFIIHGWQSEHNASWCFDLTKAILDKYPESQVILVGWERPASENIAFSAFNTESVGYLVGILINRLVTDYNIPKSNFILIGHSLGGQIAGWAGKKFQAIRGEKLPRIVALDPAGPLFTFRPDSRRLNKDDADVVMVIHTNGGIMGFRDRCGTIDFFPNGGSCQPGCVRLNLQSIDALLDPLTCSHTRSHTYLTQAITVTRSFLGRKCPTYGHFQLGYKCQETVADMGNFTENAEGSFYLETESKSPFSKILRAFLNAVETAQLNNTEMEKRIEELNAKYRAMEIQN
ncbi:hypothetical protein HHI36_002650 [Cryptolaemus montrouzieri]|uniref:Lipase domain-containing protein n=1 Tax=Cryptolaemus montrouzieri TaxID=559131 RepID=A0ABD2PCP0_9CUCU